MKATGMIRSLDQLGRIVIPIELRRVLDIEIGDGLEFYSDENAIVLKNHPKEEIGRESHGYRKDAKGEGFKNNPAAKGHIMRLNRG